MRILLADDEKDLCRALTEILKRAGYLADAVYNGRDALTWALSGQYDLFLFDVMMPEMDGLAVVRELRARGVRAPVLLLTAKGELTDRVEGLDAGADDYLAKPFAMEELLARVRAAARRTADYTADIIAFQDLRLDRNRFILSRAESVVQLSNREFQLMEMLMINAGRCLSSDLIFDRLWGLEAESGIGVVWAYISYLRKKIAGIGSNVEIRAVRGVGYMLGDGKV